MSLWFKVQGMMGDDPPYLAVGTEVSAKYKGAFCEAKVRKVVRSVKCKVTFKQGLGTVTVTDDHIRGTLRVGAVCEVKHPEKKEIIEATISKIQDCSQYTVVFDDGDITTLRRSALCLKSGRHFAESETLDQLPLTHPEHFGNPVIGGRKGRRSRQTQDDSSDDESVPKKGKKKEEKEADIGKVVCVELGDKKKQKDNWFPGLVVAPTAQDTVRIRVKDEYLVRSFKDGRYFTVPKKEATSFTREIGNKVDNNTLKTAVEKALQYLDRDDLPPHWDRDLLFGIAESSANSDGLDSDSSDDEPREEKDHFVAQLYKFMDDRGTPINKGPTIGTRDVDLYKLFKVVDKLGGYNRVTNHNQWKTISHKLGFGQNSSSITNLVKQAYKKFLHSFEDFYRKLGCTMVNHPRGDRSRHRSGRSLIRDRDRATPVNTLKDKDKEKQMPTTSVQAADKVEVEGVEKKEATKPEEEKKDKQEDMSKLKEVKKEKIKVKEEKIETLTREERKNERLKSKEETQTSSVSEKQKKKDEKSKTIEVFKEKTDEKDDKKGKKEDKMKDKELKGKIADEDSVDVEIENKTKSKVKKEEKSKSASERTRSKDEERFKLLDDKKGTEDKNKLMDERSKPEEKRPMEEKSRLSEGKTKLTETKKKLTEARNKKGTEDKIKHFDSKKSSELNSKESRSKSEIKGKIADDKNKAPDSKVKPFEEKGKVTELKTRSDDKSKLQDEKLNLAELKNKANDEKKFGEEKVKSSDLKIKASESKIKELKVETKSKPDTKCEEKLKAGDEKQKLAVGNMEEMDSNMEKDNCEKRVDNDKQLTRSRSKEDQRLKKEQPSVSEQRSKNRESKTPVRETAEKKPPPRKKEEMVFVLKKRGRKRKDTETKIEEGLGQVANNVNIVIGDKLKVYYGPTQESKVTYEAKVLDIEEDGLDRMYLVHYTGWNTRYDEWIKRSRIADSLSWSPSRAKRLRQQEAQLKALKQSGSRRGRPSRDSVPPPRPRSATPSSVTSSSSRTKSPAGSNHSKNQGSYRGGRGRALFRRRTRRTSGHTDISMASETDTEDFESEVEVEPEPEVELSRLRSGNEKRNTAVEKDDSSKEGIAKDEDIKEEKVLRQKTLIKKEVVDVSYSSTQEEEEDTEVQDDYKDESLDQSTELDTSSEVLVFETRRSTRSRKSFARLYERKDSSLKRYITKSETGTESDDDQPKGRDFDLNEIRSELKGIEKAVKVPQKAVGGSDVKGEGNLEDIKNVESEDTSPSKEVKAEPSMPSKSSVKEEVVVEDVYEFKEPEPFEFEVRPKKDFEDRSPKITRRHLGRIFDDQNVEKDEVTQCEGKQLKRAACQLFDSDEMSEDKTDSDNPESEVKTKFAKRFALSVFDNLEDKISKFDLNEIVDRPGIEIKACLNISSDNRLSEEIKETENIDSSNSIISEIIQPEEVMTVVHATEGISFGKKSPKDTLTDEVMHKNEDDSLIFEELKYVAKVDKKVEDVDFVEKQAVILEKSIGGIFEDEVCTLGQPDNELVIESHKDLRFTSAVKLFEDEEVKMETVVTEVLSDKLVSTSSQLVFEGSLTNDKLPSELNIGNVPKISGVHKEIADGEESIAPIKSEPETNYKSNQNIKKSGKKILDSSKSPRKKIVREPDGKTTAPEKKVRRSGGKKIEEAVMLDSSGNRPVSACEEAFDKLCESPSFRLVSKRSPTPAELEPLNIFTENTQEDEEDRLIIPDDIGIGEPLFSYPRSHEELFPTLVEPQKKIDSSSVSGEFQFSNNDGEKDTSHAIDFQLKSEEVRGDKVAPKLHFNISVDETEKVTDTLEVSKDADMHMPKKNDRVLDQELKMKEQEEDVISCMASVQQVTQQPILEVTDDVFGKRSKREPALLPVRFTGTDSSDTDSSDEGPRLVIAPDDEEFSQLTPSQEELQETVVDVTTSEIVLEEIKMGPLAEVEDQIQQEVEVEVVDESQERVKLTDEESVLDELETGPIVVKVDLSSAVKVDNTETVHGPVVELKIGEEETTVCVVETTEATECEVLGSLLCQETIPGSPAAIPQPSAEETAAPAVEMPFASAPGSSPGPRPLPEPAPVPGASGKSHAAPVLDNTPPTTPDSSMSTLSDERGGMSPTLDNESSKSHRDSFEIDLDSCVEGVKVDHFSEDDSLVNVEVSCSSDSRLRTQKPSCVKESLPKKRRRSRRRSEGEPNKRSRQSSGRSPRSSTHNGCASDSDDMSEGSTTGCVLENSLSARSPRPSKYNFYVELDPELDCSQRIALLQQKLQELRKTYMNIKAELACIDRRRKKLRRREREEKATKQEVTCS